MLIVSSVMVICLFVIAYVLETFTHRYRMYYDCFITIEQPKSSHPFLAWCVLIGIAIIGFALLKYYLALSGSSFFFNLGFLATLAAFMIAQHTSALIIYLYAKKYPHNFNGHTTLHAPLTYWLLLHNTIPGALIIMIIPFFTLTYYTAGAALAALIIVLARMVKNRPALMQTKTIDL